MKSLGAVPAILSSSILLSSYHLISLSPSFFSRKHLPWLSFLLLLLNPCHGPAAAAEGRRQPPLPRPEKWGSGGPILGKMTRAEGAEEIFLDLSLGQSDPKWTMKHGKNPYFPYFCDFHHFRGFWGHFGPFQGIFGHFPVYFGKICEKSVFDRFWSV